MNIDIVIPVYNEEAEVVKETILELLDSVSGSENALTIYVVNDGSDEKYNLSSLKAMPMVTFIEHSVNRGYGSSLKTGILAGKADWIGIIDADGTYPAAELPNLIAATSETDMVVGARIGEVSQIPWLRRFPKACLNKLASYMSGSKISDLNSGMRLFKRDLCYQFWGLLPNRFSFTSTITMGSIGSGYNVVDVPINYYKRVGNSSIHPIKDTIKFTKIIIKMGALFHPGKMFDPIASILFSVGFFKGLFVDFMNLGYIGNLSTLLMLSGVQIFLLGYLGQLIVSTRRLTVNSYCKNKML